jgi:predicted amidohydrolase
MRVTSVQLEIREGGAAPVAERVAALLEGARGSDLILLPEMWPCGYFGFERYRETSEPMDGPTVGMMRAQARALGAHLLMGSFPEREGEDLYNTTLLLGPDGAVLARYRKVHLFGYGSEERRLLRAGRAPAAAKTPWGVAGLSTCYDLRFPEFYRRLLDLGAEMFLVTAAWPAARREAWKLFNRARAHENLAHVFACNCAGRQGGNAYGGHSLAVDPWGRIVAEAGEGEELLTVEIDPSLAGRARREFPALADRVPLDEEHRPC